MFMVSGQTTMAGGCRAGVEKLQKTLPAMIL
jgi:hypothetical protein